MQTFSYEINNWSQLSVKVVKSQSFEVIKSRLCEEAGRPEPTFWTFWGIVCVLC